MYQHSRQWISRRSRTSSSPGCFFSTAKGTNVPPAIRRGDRVTLHLHGRIHATGETFEDTKTKSRPISFIVGNGEIINGINDAVLGMSVGQSSTIQVAPEQAFGPLNPDLVLRVSPDELQLDPDARAKVKVGHRLSFDNGRTGVVRDMGEKWVLDMNHMLAGQELAFELDIEAFVAHAELLRTGEASIVPNSVIQEGDGITYPKVGQILSMHYIGMLEDGTVFDSSRDRGQAFEFTIGVGQVIKGWDEGVLKMSKGERAKLNIPAAKGYGAQGAGATIPPNADLIFDVELLDIRNP